MVERERRRQDPKAHAATLRAGLTLPQLEALRTLEHFEWTLRFVRRPLFLEPVPILFAPDGSRFVVVEADGTINENPGFEVRS